MCSENIYRLTRRVWGTLNLILVVSLVIVTINFYLKIITFSYFDTRPLYLYHLRFWWFRVYMGQLSSARSPPPLHPAFPLQSYKVKTCQLRSPVALRESSGTKCWTVNLKDHGGHAVFDLQILF